MDVVKLSRATMSFYAPRFEVEIENLRLSADMAKAVIDVSVDTKMDEGASFRMTIHDDFDMKTQTYRWLDHELFTPGNTVTIRMGYGSELTVMVMGNITRIEPSFFSGETPTIDISGQDLSYDSLKRSSPERTFLNESYSDIVRRVASEAGLTATVDETGVYEPFVRKNSNTTFYSFLKELARRAGFTLSVEQQTLSFVKPRDDRKEVLTLELGKDIISFRPAMNTTGLYTEVEVRGHNPQDPSTPIVGRATAGSERSQEPERRTASQVVEQRHGAQRKVITNVIVNSVEHANAIASSLLNEASDTYIEGEAECVGLSQIKPGLTISLEKMGNRFSGKYYVKEATHTMNNSGYRTRFTVKRNAE